MSDFNRLSLDGCLLEKTHIRKSLTGVPVVEVLLQHSSDQTENGVTRQTQFEISAVAIGDVALVLEDCTVGAYYRVQGFLNRKSLKSAKLRMHITHIAPISSLDSSI